jgi:putative heme-binding domain-containing protein
VEFLTSAPGSLLLPTLQSLLDARQPVELQLRAVAGLSGSQDEQAASILLADWKSLTPQVRSAVLDALFRRLDRLPRLLDALENGSVPAQVLDPLQRAQLTAAPRAEISSRAQSLFAGLAANVSQEVVDRYQEALAAPRDAERGHAVYQKHCSPCHRLQGQGYEVGPDLATAKTRADETLLLDMLDPSGQVTAGYSSYMVITDSGRAFTGILAAESATGVTLRWQEGATETILRNEIDVMKATDLSLMPADFQTQVTPQDVADLIAYLRAALGPAAPPGHVLFDDEPTFVERLDEGTGTARLVMGDRFSGAAALCISPPQKFSASIAGWDYSIREHPGENEYRYLRFAWKARGDGIMLELAAAGGWAPAEQPFGRYYSGRNTTGWQAHEISALPPREWTEVVVDLWQDCGSFQLTGIAPTAIGGEALFDRFELLRSPGP